MCIPGRHLTRALNRLSVTLEEDIFVLIFRLTCNLNPHHGRLHTKTGTLTRAARVLAFPSSEFSFLDDKHHKHHSMYIIHVLSVKIGS